VESAHWNLLKATWSCAQALSQFISSVWQSTSGSFADHSNWLPDTRGQAAW